MSSEIARGLDIFELAPSAFISQNEIDAAKTVHLDYLNAQGQPKLVWPPSFALARAYVDQLERSQGLEAGRIAAVREALAGAEKARGAARRDALTTLATGLDADASGAGDAREGADAGGRGAGAGRHGELRGDPTRVTPEQSEGGMPLGMPPSLRSRLTRPGTGNS